MEFTGPDVESIEAALEARFPGRWRRLSAAGAAALPKALRAGAGWVVRLPADTVLCSAVDALSIILDADYPASQPRVLVPALKEGAWPHVEDHGLLCLKKTRLGADSGERVVQHIAWAIELLNLDEASQRREFSREFATYWERSGDGKPATEHTWVSTLVPGSRDVSFYFDGHNGRVVWASDRAGLRAWLESAGLNPANRDFKRGWLHWFEEPPAPDSFPRSGVDLLDRIPRELLEEIVRPGASVPVLVGATTETGSVLAVVELSTASQKDLLKGFRPSHLPPARVVQSIAARPVRRFPVRRADAPYVHGRDHDAQFARLATMKVAIVGCGSLGGCVARLLAQAGVGAFTFVDHDRLRAHNTSRHVLGGRFVGRYKSDAMAAMLREDFPHIRSATSVRQRIELVTQEQLGKILDCNVVISGGISYLGDLTLNRWRLANGAAPAHVCSWVEPFALAGHALAVTGRDDLRHGFTADGYPLDTLSDWPEDVGIMLAEAGCGNMFQPHGAVELQRTALMAARLALDMLLDTVTASCRRVWQGDREEVVRLGGTPNAEFQVSNIEVGKGWFELGDRHPGANR